MRAVARFERDECIRAAELGGRRRSAGLSARTAASSSRSRPRSGICAIRASCRSLATRSRNAWKSTSRRPSSFRPGCVLPRMAGAPLGCWCRSFRAGGEEAEEDSAAAIAWRDAERGIQAVTALRNCSRCRSRTCWRSDSGSGICGCSRGRRCSSLAGAASRRVAGLLRSLGADEVRDVLREQGAVEVTCEFCQRPYQFDAFAVEQLFAPDSIPDSSTSVH